ncbi:isochorismate synthase DhbC [Zooshikella marina]|uniref:isochorismate synthase DhbC n=1 Tax=Zooshikella ganghwensis TaxID=202772 RepID=UPI001BB0C80F|nr:isochorismate synthase DhbC [Zooshikella ganghwensis]MBU2708332.1 isochorismate synthase DhbC [Zooshikella ganghwensis]
MNESKRSTTTGVDLIAQFYQQQTPFFFTTANYSLLTSGNQASVNLALNDRALFSTIQGVLAEAQAKGSENPIIVGAIPFAVDAPMHLWVPETVNWGKPLPEVSKNTAGDVNQSNNITSSNSNGYAIQQTPLPETYMQGVESALQRFKHSELSKVVLSRALDISLPQQLDMSQLLHKLAQHNRAGYTFAVSLPVDTQQQNSHCKTLVGASPELLINKQGTAIRTNPLAGSAARSADHHEDQQRAHALLDSTKDQHEHALVIESVNSALKPFCKNLSVPNQPSLIHTETLWHLSTDISGELVNPATTVLELASALHPTPAVCGFPANHARDAIAEIEPFDRGFFTGMVGWMDSQGNGEWVVTIRCAEVEALRLRLFAGAGVVSGSIPQHELMETATKFKTMLNAVGLTDVAEVA